MAPPSGPGEESGRFLVLALERFGDCAIALPFVLQLRRQWPDAKLTVVVNALAAPLFSDLPNCRVLPLAYETGLWNRWFLLPGRRFQFARDQLWQDTYTACIIARFDADSQSAVLLGYFSGAAQRISYSEHVTFARSHHNRGHDRLLTTALPSSQGPEAARILRLLSALAPQPVPIAVPRAHTDTAWAGQHLRPELRWVALCPSHGTDCIKQWGLERWAEVGVQLAARGYGIVLVGDSQDQQAARTVEAGIGGRCVNLVGATTVGQLAAVLARCDLFLGNDTGPMHLASVLNRPTVAVMGSTCLHRFGAWSDRAVNLKMDLPCSPCSHHRRERCRTCIYDQPKCMVDILPTTAVAAAIRLLQQDPAAQAEAGTPRS